MGIFGIIFGIICAIVVGKGFNPQSVILKVVYVLVFPFGFDLIWFVVQYIRCDGNMFWVGRSCFVAFISSAAYLLAALIYVLINKNQSPKRR